MIEPELHGSALRDEILHSPLQAGRAQVWRLGQSGVVARFASARVLFDAYLSNHGEAVLGAPFDHRRMTRSPLDPVDLDFLDVILCSHDHLDHLDPPTLRTLARQNPTAVVAAPATAAAQLRELGWEADRIIAATHGTVEEVGGLRLEAFAVPHDEFDADADGNFPYLGWIVDDGAIRIAHLGDARAHDSVTAALAATPVDLLAAPINGRDERRAEMGFAGNMSAEEAVETARVSNARLTLPMHYDMFSQNVDDRALGRFIEAASLAGVSVQVLPVGRALTLGDS